MSVVPESHPEHPFLHLTPMTVRRKHVFVRQQNENLSSKRQLKQDMIQGFFLKMARQDVN